MNDLVSRSDQSVCDSKVLQLVACDHIIDVINQRFRCRTLPRGPGLSPISRDVIGLASRLASRFGSIIVK